MNPPTPPDSPERRGDRPADDVEPAPGGLLGIVIRGTGLAAGGYILAQVLNLAAYVVLARLLVPAEFGIFAAGTALLGIALLLSESGMIAAVVQRRDRVPEAANTAVIATLASGVAVSLAAFACAPLLGIFFDDSQVTAVAAAMSGVIFLHAASAVPSALLQRRFSLLRRMVVEPLQVIAFAASAIIAADSGLGVWSLVIGQYAGVVVELISSWALCRWKPELRLASLEMWRELMGFARHVFAATVLRGGAQQLDAFIVGRAFGADLLGNFRYGARIASVPFWALYASASYVLFPAFSRIAHENERLVAALLRSLRWTAIITFPLSFALVGLGEPLAVILFGEIWREAGIAAAAMAGYAAGNMLASVVSQAMKAFGRPDRLPRMQGVIAGATLALMLAAVPFGFTMVAAAVSGGAIAGAVYALWTASRVMDVELRRILSSIWPAALAAAGMAVALLGLEDAVDAAQHPLPASALLVVGEGLAGIALFAALLVAISPGDRVELKWAAGEMVRRVR